MVDYEKKNYKIVIVVSIICVLFFLFIVIGTIITNSSKKDDDIDTHSIDYIASNFKCSYSSNLSAISDGEKIGFIDRDKHFVIDYQYDIPNDNYCDDSQMLYNFYGNYAIVYKDNKYVVIDKDNTIVDTFDDIYTLNLENNDIKCLYVSKNADVKLYCIDRNKIIDVVLYTVSLEKGKIVYTSNDDVYINGDFLFYKKDDKAYCYNLVTDSNFELDSYSLNIVLDEKSVPKSESSLFIKYIENTLSIKNSNFEDLFTLELGKHYDSISFIPSTISSGKYYFMVKIGDKIGVIDSNGNEIVPVDKDGSSFVKIKNSMIYVINGDLIEKYSFTGKLVEE